MIKLTLLILLLAAMAAGVSGFSTSHTFFPTFTMSRRRMPLKSSSSSSSASSTSSSAPSTPSSDSSSSTPASTSSSSSSSMPFELNILNADAATDQWELDCYSRPVILPETNKKLWELLVTDSAGSFRFCQPIPSANVNSKTVRQCLEQLIEHPSIVVKPVVIRFFRGAMFNMIKIALQDLQTVGLTALPSRCTLTLASWLEERQRQVYPNMAGYSASMLSATGGASSILASTSSINVRTPVKLPDALRGEQYAFVALPLAEFLPSERGGTISDENIGVGRLCPLPPNLISDGMAAADVFVQGVVILTRRAEALAAWLAGTEVVALTADLRKRSLLMETDLDTQYLMAKLNDEQRMEGAMFEQGKEVVQGLHFISVQATSEDEVPAGFWLLRDLPAGI